MAMWLKKVTKKFLKESKSLGLALKSVVGAVNMGK